MRANLRLFPGGMIICLFLLYSTIIFAQPVFQPPVSLGFGVPVHPTFNWTNPSGYTDFQVLVFDGATVIYNSGSLGAGVLSHTPALYGTNPPLYNNLGANLVSGNTYNLLLYYYDGVMWQSTGMAFTTGISSPTAISATGINTTVFNANWNVIAGATGYRLDVSTASNFSSFVPGYNNLDVTNVLTYQVTGLSPNTYYYYRVRSYNPGETSVSSNVITVLTYPGMPGLTAPADNSFGIPLSVNLTWAALPAPVDVYYLQVDDNSDFSSVLFEGNVGAVISYHPAGLANNVKYYWRLQAHNPSNYGPYTAARAFTTALITPGGLTVTSPLGSPVPSRTPVVGWTSVPGANFYDVRIKTAAGVVVEAGVVPTNSYSIATSLTPGAAYKFDVRALNTVTTNFSEFSAEHSFTILPLPTVPVLVSPANNAHGIPLNQTFTWNPSANGTINYTFGISIDNTNWTTTSAIPGASYAIPPGVLAYETEYVWRVSAQNEVGTSACAPIFHIFTQLKPPTLTYPVDLSVGHPLQPRLTWVQPAHGPNHGTIWGYEIQYAKSIPDLTDGVGSFHSVSVGNQLFYDILTSLDNNIRYYWRVRAIELVAANNYPGAWSSVFSFKTTAVGLSGVQIPNLFNPVDNYTVYTLTPQLSWGTYQAGITSYELQYTSGNADALAASALIVVPVTGNNTFYTLPALYAGEDYLWRVRSFNPSTGIYSGWSVTQRFVIDISQGPTIPYASYPVDQVVYTNYPTFYWYTLSAATGILFDVEVQRLTPSAVTIPLMNNINLTGLSYLLDVNEAVHNDSLLKPGNYQWRVTAHKPGYSVTSAWAPFTISGIAINIPVKPIISWPRDAALLYSLVPTLNWYTGSTNLNNIVFDWQISTSSAVNGSGAFTSTVDFGTGNAPVVSGVGPLNNATVYYWHVRARNTVTTLVSDWSDIETFQTTAGVGGVPGSPSLIYPVGIVISNLTPTLGWSAPNPSGTIANYRLEISSENNPDFVTFRFVDTAPTTTSYVIPPGTLINGVTYYWRVSASYVGPAGPWGAPTAIGSFTTMAGSAPVVPMTANPVYGSVFRTESPALSWYLPTKGESLSYELQYSTNKQFTDAVTIEGLDKPNFDLSNLPSGQYYWRVRSKNSNGEYSYYSGRNEFRIGDAVTAVETKENIIPETFEVKQNYPNPFNPSTTISFGLPEASRVSVRIYDMLGREIKMLLNEEVQAGTHQLVWNGDNNYGQKVSSGTYIYRVVSGSNVKSMKMILLK